MTKDAWWKKGLRSTAYVILALVGLAAIEKGAAEAIGVLCIVVVWATLRLDRRLSALRSSIESRRTGPEV